MSFSSPSGGQGENVAPKLGGESQLIVVLYFWTGFLTRKTDPILDLRRAAPYSSRSQCAPVGKKHPRYSASFTLIIQFVSPELSGVLIGGGITLAGTFLTQFFAILLQNRTLTHERQKELLFK